MQQDGSPLREMLLWSERQLLRTLLGAKGIAIVGLTLLAILSVAGLAQSIEQLPHSFTLETSDVPSDLSGAVDAAKDMLPDPKVMALSVFFHDEKVVALLAKAPNVLLVMFILGGFLTPGLVMLLGYDLIGGEGHVRTLRYFVGRSRRWTLFLGKLFGLMATITAVSLLLEAVVVAVAVARGQSHLGEAVTWGIRFWMTSLPSLLGWCAVTALVSAAFPEPMVSLLAANGVFFGLWVLHFHHLGQYVYPDTYTEAFLTSDARSIAIGLLSEVGIIAGAAGIGAFVLERGEV